MTDDAQQLASLRQSLADHEHRLHVLEYPSASERTVIRLRRELANVENSPPPADSPALRQPARARTEFEWVEHSHVSPNPPSISSLAELRHHHARIAAVSPEPTYVALATLSGCDAIISYRDGILTKAVLRGDGERGVDITDNVRCVESVPLRLRPPGTITESRATKVTKELIGPSTVVPVPPFPDALDIKVTFVLRHTDLAALDRRRIDCGEPPYISTEGAVLGSLRRLDPVITASRPLVAFATDVADVPPSIDTHWQLLGALKSWGFRVMPLSWRCRGLQEVLDFVQELQRVAPDFEYPLEGGELIVSRRGFAAATGGTVAPPARVRLVFPAPGRPAIVQQQYMAVGRGGSLLPVLLLARPPDHTLPLPERAPLPAFDGDHVLYTPPEAKLRVRPGPVAPIVRPEEPRGISLDDPKCPACGEVTRKPLDEAFPRCVNLDCAGRARARLLHLVGPRGLALQSVAAVADSLVSKLGDTDLVGLLSLDPAEVAKIAPGQEDAFAKEHAQHMVMPLWRLLYLMGGPGVGERDARLLAHYAKNFERLLRMGTEDLLRVTGLNPEARAGFSVWIRAEGIGALARVRALNVRILSDAESYSAPFVGRVVVVAGRFARGAAQVADDLERRGARIQARVGRTSDFLVLGEEARGAFDAAAMYDVLVIEEKAIERLLSS